MRDKIDRKYSGAIWAIVIIGYVLNNVYLFYYTFATTEFPAVGAIFAKIIWAILEYIVLPIFILSLLGSVTYSAGFRRGARFISRFDFNAHFLVSTAAVKGIVGVISIFAILVPAISYFASEFEYVLVYLMYLFVFFKLIVKKYNLNPVEKYNAFRVWFTVYLIFAGLLVASNDLIVLTLLNNPEFYELLYDYGVSTIYISRADQIVSIVSISIYGVMLIVSIVMNFIFKKQAREYQDPIARSEYNEKKEQQNYEPNPFDEFNSKSSSNVSSDNDKDDISDIFDI